MAKVDKLLEAELKKMNATDVKDSKLRKYENLLHSLRVEISELY